jgi:hypothetical protein
MFNFFKNKLTGEILPYSLDTAKKNPEMIKREFQYKKKEIKNITDELKEKLIEKAGIQLEVYDIKLKEIHTKRTMYDFNNLQERDKFFNVSFFIRKFTKSEGYYVNNVRLSPSKLLNLLENKAKLEKEIKEEIMIFEEQLEMLKEEWNYFNNKFLKDKGYKFSFL